MDTACDLELRFELQISATTFSDECLRQLMLDELNPGVFALEADGSSSTLQFRSHCCTRLHHCCGTFLRRGQAGTSEQLTYAQRLHRRIIRRWVAQWDDHLLDCAERSDRLYVASVCQSFRGLGWSRTFSHADCHGQLRLNVHACNERPGDRDGRFNAGHALQRGVQREGLCSAR
jgi:hypothetical protein